MEDQTKPTPVIEETDILRPKACVGCGAEEDVKVFAFKTNAYFEQRQILAYCPRCRELVARALTHGILLT